MTTMFGEKPLGSVLYKRELLFLTDALVEDISVGNGKFMQSISPAGALPPERWRRLKEPQ